MKNKIRCADNMYDTVFSVFYIHPIGSVFKTVPVTQWSIDVHTRGGFCIPHFSKEVPIVSCGRRCKLKGEPHGEIARRHHPSTELFIDICKGTPTVHT